MNIGDKVFCTKYALGTEGVREAVVIRISGSSVPSVKLDIYGVFGGWFNARTEVFSTREEALADCEKRRTKAIEATERKLAKLRAMKFK